jgi:hypothetical protein
MRAVKPLAIAEKMPQPVRRAMPTMSDLEIGLRLNVPDGLATDGSHPYKYITASTDEHRNPDESPIRREK